ncbi:GspH/FimT family pseudopilin [Marinagarivorans algicola]|uniref:GspH/FimT family pseudopilin n=1 Tax=Marinagarivorans algicola TaxID=1513270 RepID=UPI0009EB4672|nr:GspH/FimT family pseudopilin [Marinagarivorans algicola]
MINSSRGMTLVELMIVIAIAAILLTVAAPSFKGLIARSNIETLQDQFALSVITARTEAASRGVKVRLCPSPMPTTATGKCVKKDWVTDGWVAFYVDSADKVQMIAEFKNKPGYPLGVFEAGTTTKVAEITFNSQGYNAERKRFTFVVCDKSVDPTYAKGVMVELSGRTVFTQDKSNLHNEKFHTPTAGGTSPSLPLKPRC